MIAISPWSERPKPETKYPPIVGIAIAALAWAPIIALIVWTL